MLHKGAGMVGRVGGFRQNPSSSNQRRLHPFVININL